MQLYRLAAYNIKRIALRSPPDMVPCRCGMPTLLGRQKSVRVAHPPLLAEAAAPWVILRIRIVFSEPTRGVASQKSYADYDQELDPHCSLIRQYPHHSL